jgi:hypothetical protein
MRRVSSCLLLVLAPFFLHSASTEAEAAGTFRGHFGYRSGSVLTGRFHPPAGRLSYHHSGFRGRFLHKPLVGHSGFRPFRHGVLPYGFSSWSPLATDPAVETTIINQVGGLTGGSGRRSGCCRHPKPSSRRSSHLRDWRGSWLPAGGRKYARARPGPKMVSMRPHGVGQLQPRASGHGAGPRVIHVTAPSGW